MNFLVDTNLFLEILLNQAGRKKCEAFLQGEKGADAGVGADFEEAFPPPGSDG